MSNDHRLAPVDSASPRHVSGIFEDLSAMVYKDHLADLIISLLPHLTEPGRTVVPCFHKEYVAAFLKEGRQIITGAHIT